jgi:hypothetical protein
LPQDAQWSIAIQGRRLPSFDRTVITQHIHGDDARAYWGTKHNLPDPASDVDWTIGHFSIRNSPLHMQLWIPKWMTGRLPIGGTLKKWGYQQTDVCPRCGQPELNSIHVVKCSSPPALSKWDAFLSTLEDWFTQSHTLRDIKEGLLSHLRNWHAGLSGDPFECRTISAQEVFDTQNRIGWTPFFLGLLHPSWALLQQAHYAELGKRNTGKRWVTQLLQKVWKVSWDLWTHRRSILLSPDSYVFYQENLSADSAVTAAWASYLHDPNPIPALWRWFSRSLEAIKNEPLDFKKSWLDIVHTIIERRSDT